jgi:peptidoglycan/LPS O-acetylase OafA/YrhL
MIARAGGRTAAVPVAVPGRRADRAHIPALDGIRGIAILLVILNHAFSLSLQSFHGWHTFLTNIVCSTGFGVQLFFVLSGFLITGLLVDAKGSSNYFSSFYGRRALRILPLYYGTIVVIGAAFHFSRSDHEWLFRDRLPWLLTFSQNILIALRKDWSFVFGPFSLGHFWSLAVEEQFYLLWPLIVLWCSPRMLVRICYVLIPLALAARLTLLWGYDNILGTIVSLPSAVDSLAIGALIAVLIRHQEQTLATKAWPMITFGGLIWLLCCLDMSMLLTLGISGFCVMCGGLLVAALYNRRAAMVSCNRVLRSFGKYSYAIYVFHVLLLAWILPWKAAVGLSFFTALFVTLSYSIGWLSWHLFEVHFLRLKSLLPIRPAVATTGGASRDSV